MNNKQDMSPYNSEGQLHGLCIHYHNNGNINLRQKYINGVKYGLCEQYFDNRELWYKEYYKGDKWVYSEWYNGLNEITFCI